VRRRASTPILISPSSILVLLISPTMSFLSRLASRSDEQRLIPRRKDSNCRTFVRMVIVSDVDAEMEAGGW
jgi:hypothetical protein